MRLHQFGDTLERHRRFVAQALDDLSGGDHGASGRIWIPSCDHRGTLDHFMLVSEIHANRDDPTPPRPAVGGLFSR
jgi:hypothetical protein